LRRAIAKGARNPIVLNRLIDSAVKSVTLDEDFSTRDLARLARRFRSLAPEAVHTFVLPTAPAVINKADVLLLDKVRAQDVINQFNGFLPAPPLVPGRVEVRLRDAGGARTGAAMTAARNRFAEIGFVTTTSAEEDDLSDESTPTRLVRTVVRHGPDDLDKARYVAAHLIGGAELEEDASLTGTDVEVDLGASYAGLRDQAAGAVGPVFKENDDAAAHACT
jgi:hypothetical protein